MTEIYPHSLAGQALWNWRSRAKAEAKAAGIDLAEVDWLLLQLCQIDRLSLRLGTLATQPAVAAQLSLAELQSLWKDRLRDRVPVQHLAGQTIWRNFTLHVSPAVLIPRPETELMIDVVAKLVQESPHADTLSNGVWVDMGTGSGAIALGLAQQFPDATVLATDVSETALGIARQNAQANGLGDRIHHLQGSWFVPLEPWRGKIVGIVSNPPYIPTQVILTLEPEVINHEPRLALDGGPDGLDAIRHLMQHAPDYLCPQGIWLVEHMLGQSAAIVSALESSHAFRQVQVWHDLARVERFVSAQKK